ncbi:MAG: hypothetical protein Kow00117_19870 [Phototrophicales bacterium]
MINNKHTQNDNIVLGLSAAAVMVFIGLFLPIVTFKFGEFSDSIAFMSGEDGGAGSDGILIIGLIIISGILIALKRTRWVILTGILILGIVIVNYIDVSDLVNQTSDFSDSISMGMLAWGLLFLGSFGLIGAGGLAFKNSRNT